MKHRLLGQSHVLLSRRATVALLSLCLLLMLGTVALGCGSASDSTTSTAATGDSTSTTASTGGSPTTEGTASTDGTGTTTAMSGKQLGQTVGAAWAKAMQQLNGLLAGQPEVSEVKGSVAALKEQYIKQLIKYGAQKQSLDATGKSDATAAVAAALAAAANTDWYKTYMSNYDAYAYASGDVDFVNVLASFNTLTQYADYDLLKSQDPKEATRLGIK